MERIKSVSYDQTMNLATMLYPFSNYDIVGHFIFP